jgi:hypothetical protein
LLAFVRSDGDVVRTVIRADDVEERGRDKMRVEIEKSIHFGACQIIALMSG